MAERDASGTDPGKPIDASCCLPEYGGLFGMGERCSPPFDNMPPFRVAACHGANRPICSNHQTLWAKALKHHIKKKPQQLRCPRLWVRLGDESRYLSGHVRSLGKFADIATPEIYFILRNGRFAHVVENEAVSRKLIDERNDFGELMGIDKKIVD